MMMGLKKPFKMAFLIDSCIFNALPESFHFLGSFVHGLMSCISDTKILRFLAGSDVRVDFLSLNVRTLVVV